MAPLALSSASSCSSMSHVLGVAVVFDLLQFAGGDRLAEAVFHAVDVIGHAVVMLAELVHVFGHLFVVIHGCSHMLGGFTEMIDGFGKFGYRLLHELCELSRGRLLQFLCEFFDVHDV